MAGKAVVSLTTGLEDTERVTVAFLVAVGAAEQGRPTLMSLSRTPGTWPVVVLRGLCFSRHRYRLTRVMWRVPVTPENRRAVVGVSRPGRPGSFDAGRPAPKRCRQAGEVCFRGRVTLTPRGKI